MVMNKRFT